MFETRRAQATWACNALCAVCSDNNRLAPEPERAGRYLEACLRFGPENPGIYFNAACVAFQLGDHDRVFDYIACAVRYKYENLEGIRDEPLLAPLRRDPRFDAAFVDHEAKP